MGITCIQVVLEGIFVKRNKHCKWPKDTDLAGSPSLPGERTK